MPVRFPMNSYNINSHQKSFVTTHAWHQYDAARIICDEGTDYTSNAGFRCAGVIV
jgi:hypothetical protein